MYVYYRRTYGKAVRGGGGGKREVTPLAAACAFELDHLTLLSGAGGGGCEQGGYCSEEEGAAQGGVKRSDNATSVHTRHAYVRMCW